MTKEEIRNIKDAEEFAVVLPNGIYFAIQTGTEGYDYTFYNQDFLDLDGGIFTSSGNITEVATLLLEEEYDYDLSDCLLCDYDELEENCL